MSEPKTRSWQQNKRLWAMLTDVSRQVNWHGQRLTKEEWKDVFTAALKRQKVVPGIDGGFVVLGSSTSRMTMAEMGDLITLMEAFGAQQGVKFTAPEYAEQL
jgi:NinB protein